MKKWLGITIIGVIFIKLWKLYKRNISELTDGELFSFDEEEDW